MSQETAVKAIDEISANGPTNISAGVTTAIEQFKAEFKRRWVTRCMDCGETIRGDHRGIVMIRSHMRPIPANPETF